jgi:ATPase subunit of ABC transporter with duplicated ATPase domains
MKSTKVMSGGEAVRLLFCKLMLTQPNILVLDEPTNHLDLESISALGEGLQSYPGTVLFVAHDRDLIASCATRIFAFHHGGMEDFAGDYESFLEKHGGFIDSKA